jgi:phosphorylase kinase alpha/beta subunit
VITRVPEGFYERVWELLRQCRGLVIGDQFDLRNALDSTLARADTTPAEQSFALQVEDLLNKIQAPEYRQLTIEALMAVSDLCRANPELQIRGVLVIDVLLGTAVSLAAEESAGADGSSGSFGDGIDQADKAASAWQAFYASPPHRVAGFVMKAFARLLSEADAVVQNNPSQPV